MGMVLMLGHVLVDTPVAVAIESLDEVLASHLKRRI